LVTFKTFTAKDVDLNRVQANVTDAVNALSVLAGAVPTVVKVSASAKLTGAEDVVLVDSSRAQNPIYLVLPGPKVLSKPVRFKVTKAGTQGVFVKAVDIPGNGSPTLDETNQVQIRPDTGSMTVVSDGSNYWSV